MYEDETLLRNAFNAGYTRSYEWRSSQLLALLRFMTSEESSIINALTVDLNRPPNQSRYVEIARIRMEIEWALKHLKGWMSPETISPFVPLFAFHDKRIVKEPMGTVLIISPWNYPFSLSLVPLVGAIAAGNCVILKPSELSTACSQLIFERLPIYMDGRCIIVKLGEAETVTSILSSGLIDHIVFTGSTKIGKLVARAAADHMIPLTLECGGKSPAIVT